MIPVPRFPQVVVAIPWWLWPFVAFGYLLLVVVYAAIVGACLVYYGLFLAGRWAGRYGWDAWVSWQHTRAHRR